MDKFSEKIETPTFEGEGGWEFPFLSMLQRGSLTFVLEALDV